MVVVAQLVRAPGCGPGGRRFKSGLPPHFLSSLNITPAESEISGKFYLQLTVAVVYFIITYAINNHIFRRFDHGSL